MRNFFLSFILALFFSGTYSQDTSYWKRNYPNQHWQKQQDWDAPGNYEIAAKLSKSIVYKGDALDLDIYITGYGIIGNSKIYFLFSDTFYTAKSFVRTSIKTIGNQFSLGADSVNLTGGEAFLMDLRGLKNDKWPYKTFYPDMDTDSYRILSEMNVGHPPASMHIKLKPDVQPGDYSIKLFYTYYNGESWKSSDQELKFHVNSWMEEHDVLVWVLGFLISIIALIGVVPIISEYSFRLRRYIYNKK